MNNQLLNSFKRGMAEYYQQHNYRDMWNLWNTQIVPAIKASVCDSQPEERSHSASQQCEESFACCNAFGTKRCQSVVRHFCALPYGENNKSSFQFPEFEEARKQLKDISAAGHIPHYAESMLKSFYNIIVGNKKR